MNESLALIIRNERTYSFMIAHIFIYIKLKLDKMAIVDEYRNIVPTGQLSIQDATLVLLRLPIRINRCCEHVKEYLSKRNGSQPHKFSFDLTFKNTRINTHRLETKSMSLILEIHGTYSRIDGEKSTHKSHTTLPYFTYKI